RAPRRDVQPPASGPGAADDPDRSGAPRRAPPQGRRRGDRGLAPLHDDARGREAELEGGDLGGARDVPGVRDDPQRVRGALEGAERQRVRLTGQTALVSGASRGIGRAVALVFAREGARVALLARGRADLDRVAGTIEAAGGTALVVPGDAAEEDAATHAVEAALARFGR